MVENLTDDEILQRLKRYDEKVTGEFFYDICHIAYCIDDKKYGLRYKTGLDFFSLAHEYYLRLLNNDWRQIEKRKPNISLANWMMNGFHFLVRERLLSYSKGHIEESIEERVSKGQLVFDTPEDNSQEEVKEMVEEICHAYYDSDRKSQSILRMILVMGMKGKEVASLLGITPAAVSQRYHAMMNKVVRPYFLRYYDRPSVSYYDQPLMNYMRLPESPTTSSKLDLDVSSERGFFAEQFSMEGYRPMELNSDRITPSIIHTLHEDEIFVFGSDLRGAHCDGATYQVLRNFGAQLGKGVGPLGQCYAIPTIIGHYHRILPFILDFYEFVTTHPQYTFLVTPIGCGIAGFTPDEIAPMFEWAKDVDNIRLPYEFWKVIRNN